MNPEISVSEIEQVRQQSQKVGEECYNLLVIEQPVGRLPERIFKETFLPYFIGQKRFEPDSDLLKIWVGIAGNPGNCVDIIDDGNEVLFRIPPLYNTDFVSSTAATQIPFMGIIDEYHNRNASAPNLGSNFLKSVLKTTKDLITTNNNHVEEYKQMWQKMFEFYHIGETAKEQKTDQINDGEIIYD